MAASVKIDVSFKTLKSSDLRLMRQLNDVFAEAFEDPDNYGRALPSDQYLSTLLDKESFIAIAAVSHDKVLGGLAAYVLEKFEQERSEIYIFDLAVLEPYRRQGIATKLINSLKAQAGKYRAWVIFVQADKEDDPAIKLYESLGKREDVLHFDIDVKAK